MLVQPNGARVAVASRLFFHHGRVYVLVNVDFEFRGDAMVEIDPDKLRRPVVCLPDLYVYEGEVSDPRRWVGRQKQG